MFFGIPPLYDLITRAIIIPIVFTIHELSHALTATYLGDSLPGRQGRLTLNPLAHLDPIGTILFLLFGFGWAKPVQVNPYNLRNGPHMGMALVAVVGPISNLILALIAAIPVRLGLIHLSGPQTIGILPSFPYLLSQFIFLNIILFLFNLLPVTPLDGSKILRGFAPREWDGFLGMLDQYGPILLILLLVLPITGILLGGPANFLYSTIVGA